MERSPDARERPGRAVRLLAAPRDLVNPKETALEEEEKRGARDDERSHDECIPEDPEIRYSGSEASHEDTDECCNKCHN